MDLWNSLMLCMKHVQPDFRALAPLETADLHAPLTLHPLFDLVQGALHKMDHGDKAGYP